jgi:hypothetical protein
MSNLSFRVEDCAGAPTIVDKLPYLGMMMIAGAESRSPQVRDALIDMILERVSYCRPYQNALDCIKPLSGLPLDHSGYSDSLSDKGTNFLYKERSHG